MINKNQEAVSQLCEAVFLFSKFNDIFLVFDFYGAEIRKSTKKSSCQAAFFLKLCARASNPASTATFSLPRSMKRLNPWLFLILPNTGSTS